MPLRSRVPTRYIFGCTVAAGRQVYSLVIYEALNRPVLDRIPAHTRRLLDLGCGSGALGRQIKQTTSCEIVGVTFSETEAAVAAECIDHVLVRDLNTFDPAEAGQFDCVVCSHVLEHLYAPEILLRRLHASLTPDGVLLVALPNVLHWRQRLVFLRGKFRYTDGGLMDHTHFRFFDWHSARHLLLDNGYTLREEQADGTFPLSRFLRAPGRWLDRLVTRQAPALFGTQFILLAQSASGRL